MSKHCKYKDLESRSCQEMKAKQFYSRLRSFGSLDNQAMSWCVTNKQASSKGNVGDNMVADVADSWNQNTLPVGQKWGHVKATLGPPWHLCLRSPVVLLIRAQTLKEIASPYHFLHDLVFKPEIHNSASVRIVFSIA